MTHLPVSPYAGAGRLVRAAVVAACALGVAVASAGSAGAAARRETPNQRADRQVIANLWEWNWPSVANECTTVLGPNGLRRRPGRAAAGLGQAQQLGDGSDTILHPWWEVYQPVDYALTSRMGTEAAVQGHGADLPQGRREGVRRRGDQPHDRAGRHVLRRRHLHARTSYAGPLRPAQLPPLALAGDCPVGQRAASRTSTTSSRSSTASCVGLADLRTDTNARPQHAGRLPQQADRLRRLRLPGRRRQAHRPGRPGRDLLPAAPTPRTAPGPTGRSRSSAAAPARCRPEAFTRSGDVLGLDGVKQIKTRSRATPPTRRAASPR